MRHLTFTLDFQIAFYCLPSKHIPFFTMQHCYRKWRLCCWFVRYGIQKFPMHTIFLSNGFEFGYWSVGLQLSFATHSINSVNHSSIQRSSHWGSHFGFISKFIYSKCSYIFAFCQIAFNFIQLQHLIRFVVIGFLCSQFVLVNMENMLNGKRYPLNGKRRSLRSERVERLHWHFENYYKLFAFRAHKIHRI